MSNTKLAAEVGLSPSACLRRINLLEQGGVIRGYTALVGNVDGDNAIAVIINITLERQTEEHLNRFEAAVRRCPEVRACYLMTGIADYQLRVEARDAADYERIHKEQLSRMPGVARIQSSFAIRAVQHNPMPDAVAPPSLLDDLLAGGATPEQAAAAALKRVQGAFAVAIIFAGSPKTMICARQGAPLAVGFGEGEMFVGSDALALAPLTRRIAYLEEGDWAVLSEDDARFFDIQDRPVTREIRVTAVSGAATGKGNY
eukprot:gene51084-62469_t